MRSVFEAEVYMRLCSRRVLREYFHVVSMLHGRGMRSTHACKLRVALELQDVPW